MLKHGIRVTTTQPRKHGFTLVEILIVVAIIGLLVAIAIPAFSRARTVSQNTAFISDLKIARGAFILHRFDHDSHPPDANPGEVPPGMTNYLFRMRWSDETPIGGHWEWDYMQFGCTAGVSIVVSSSDMDDRLTEIDGKIDDGDLTTGCFRKREGGYIWVIE